MARKRCIPCLIFRLQALCWWAKNNNNNNNSIGKRWATRTPRQLACRLSALLIKLNAEQHGLFLHAHPFTSPPAPLLLFLLHVPPFTSGPLSSLFLHRSLVSFPLSIFDLPASCTVSPPPSLYAPSFCLPFPIYLVLRFILSPALTPLNPRIYSQEHLSIAALL